MARLLRHRPFGLITDLDGTISAIARTPGGAFIDPRCHAALAALAHRLDLVAVISGRRAADAKDKVGIEDMVYVGNHGLETWRDGALKIVAPAEEYIPRIAAALASLRATLALPGIAFEDKGLVAGIHYRLAPDAERARREVLGAVRRVAGGLRVAEGKRVVEIRPPVDRDKGEALADLVAERRLRGAIYFGDDLTDITAFRRLGRLRRAGPVHGLGIAVAGAETDPRVIRAADYIARGVGEVAEILQRMLQLLYVV